MKSVLIKTINETATYAVFGAQTIAYGAYKAVYQLTGIKPTAFLVSSKEKNPEKIEGITVTDKLDFDRSTLIIVAVTELLQKEIVEYLHINGFMNLFILSAHDEHLLMSSYYDALGIFPCAKETRLDTALDIDMVIYEAHSHKDKTLTLPPKLRKYEKSVHAGAAIGEKINTDFNDNTGENISKKNMQYCEMTVAYWVWKNQKHDWVGIEHYRRHLLVTPKMITDDVDILLPLPYICYPNEIAQFRRFVSEDICKSVLTALMHIHPKEYSAYLSILNGQYQYTYNMLCARKSVFDKYCDWFFEITEYIETMSNKIPEITETRALSYVAEVLTNIYFMYHQNDLNIRHVEKAIYT